MEQWDEVNPLLGKFMDMNAGPRQMRVAFHGKLVEDPTQSTKSGRPMFKQVDYCEKRIDQSNTVDQPVSEEDKYAYPREWAAYQRTKNAEAVEGTPLAELPFLSSVDRQNLIVRDVKTAEALAGLTKTHVAMTDFPNEASMWRDKAKAYLDFAAELAPVTQLAQENAELKIRVRELEQDVLDLSETIAMQKAKLEESKRKGKNEKD